MKRYAIFFPQFHQVKVNDLAWGYGFTDWALVATANAFEYWTRRAPARGFYNLSKPADIQYSFDEAADAGLDGFGIYHYRFEDGSELNAVEEYLLQAQLRSDFKFFFIWANESWSRRWAGKSTEILKRVSSKPGREQIRDHVAYLKPHMESGSYTRLAGQPIFVIYRPDFFADARATIELYREEFDRIGITPSLGFFLKNSLDVQYATIFDFCYAFEPRLFMNFHGVRGSLAVTKAYRKMLHFIPYERCEFLFERISRMLNRGSKKHAFAEFLEYFGSPERQSLLGLVSCPIQNVLTCGWNNAPRYRGRFTEIETPDGEQFEQMLNLSIGRHGCSNSIPLLCNAWNEWSEGAAIEPCSYLGDVLLRTYLRSTESSEIEMHT